jgi:hypothetical protein
MAAFRRLTAPSRTHSPTSAFPGSPSNGLTTKPVLPILHAGELTGGNGSFPHDSGGDSGKVDHQVGWATPNASAPTFPPKFSSWSLARDPMPAQVPHCCSGDLARGRRRCLGGQFIFLDHDTILRKSRGSFAKIPVLARSTPSIEWMAMWPRPLASILPQIVYRDGMLIYL